MSDNGFKLERHITSDGGVYATSHQADNHQKLIDDEISTCPECNGQKMVDRYGDGREFNPCRICLGIGYLKKVE